VSNAAEQIPNGSERSAVSTPAPRRINGKWVLKQLRELPLVPVLIIVLIYGAITNPVFLTAGNISNIVSQSAVLGVLVVAESLVLFVGRIDLSIESVVTLAPLIGVWLMVPKADGGLGLGLNPVLGLVLTFAIGAIVGLVNGLLVMKVNLNPFVVTLAMLILLSGLAQGIAQGNSMLGFSEIYGYLGFETWLGVSVSVWVTGILFIIAALFLTFHRVGRALYAIGGNQKSAQAAGIRVDRIVIGVFIVAGLCASLAGIMLAGRLAAVTATQGQNLIFSVLAACVIGGISLNGGRGRVLGALSGVLLLGVVQNLLILSNIASYWIDAVYGVIILIALVFARITGGKDKL
jgi:ribose/xylose/arabinose/galactoside ABC-type transport system permease subunit